MSLFNYLIADDARGHEFIVRRAPPRFVARLVSENDGDDFPVDGLTLAIDDDQTLCDFQWLGERPDDATLVTIVGEILQFLLHVEEMEERRLDERDEPDGG